MPTWIISHYNRLYVYLQVNYAHRESPILDQLHNMINSLQATWCHAWGLESTRTILLESRFLKHSMLDTGSILNGDGKHLVISTVTKSCSLDLSTQRRPTRVKRMSVLRSKRVVLNAKMYSSVTLNTIYPCLFTFDEFESSSHEMHQQDTRIWEHFEGCSCIFGEIWLRYVALTSSMSLLIN